MLEISIWQIIIWEIQQELDHIFKLNLGDRQFKQINGGIGNIIL